MAIGRINRMLRLWHGRMKLSANLIRLMGVRPFINRLGRRLRARLPGSGAISAAALYDRWVAHYGQTDARSLSRLHAALASPSAPALALVPDLSGAVAGPVNGGTINGGAISGGAEVQRIDDFPAALREARDAVAGGRDLLLVHLASPGQLADGACGRLALAAGRSPDGLLIYGDSDERVDGRRMNPAFLPDADPDWFLAADPVGPLRAVRARLLLAANERFDLLQLDPADRQHALLLTALELGGERALVHVPHILFHQEGSFPPAEDRVARGERWRAMARAHLDRLNIPADIRPHTHDPLALRLVHSLPEPLPKVTVLIPTRDCLDLLRACVDGLLERTDYANLEVLILDNGSREPQTLFWFREVMDRDERVRVLRWDHPFNFAAINNYGATEARGELLLFLNNDVEVIEPDWLTEMVGQLRRPDVGAVGARLLYSNGSLQHGGVITGILGAAGHAHKGAELDAPGDLGRLWHVRRVAAVTGACLLTTASLFRQVGGFDEDGLAVAYNDIDLCLKLRAAGHEVLWTPYATLYHHESISRGSDHRAETIHRFVGELRTLHQRWGRMLTEDPWYNPNLTLLSEDHQPGFPPRRGE